MKKRLLSVVLSVAMVSTLFAGCGSNSNADSGKVNRETTDAGDGGDAETTTIQVAAIETAYGADMWKEVADAFTAETGIEVDLITDKKLEDVI